MLVHFLASQFYQAPLSSGPAQCCKTCHVTHARSGNTRDRSRLSHLLICWRELHTVWNDGRKKNAFNHLKPNHNCSRWHFDFRFVFSRENKTWHSKWIVTICLPRLADNSHEMPSLIFSEKMIKKKKNLECRLLQFCLALYGLMWPCKLPTLFFETTMDCIPHSVPKSFKLHRTRMAFNSFMQSTPCIHVSTATNTPCKPHHGDFTKHFHDNWSSLKEFSVSGSVTIVGSVNIWNPSKSRCPKPSLRASSDTEPNRSASKQPSAIPVIALPKSLAKSSLFKESSAPEHNTSIVYNLGAKKPLTSPNKVSVFKINIHCLR